MDKSSWDMHFQKKTFFVEPASFSVSHFHISTLSFQFNVVTKYECPQSIFQHWIEAEGGLTINNFFPITERHQ